jgi:hypothetical protein
MHLGLCHASIGFQRDAAVNIILRLSLFNGQCGHGLFRLVHKVGEPFAIHPGVSHIAADELPLQIQERGAIGLARLNFRLDSGLVLAKIDEVLVTDAGIFDMGDERSTGNH